MSDKPVILWFRNDLRLTDHRALNAACAAGVPVLLIYILDDDSPGVWKMGGASRWWLAKSLAALAADIGDRGNRLVLRRGETRKVLIDLIEETDAAAVYFSREYEPWAIKLEHGIKAKLEAKGVAVKRYGGRLLREPEDVHTKSGEPFKVYTPFWRALSADYHPGKSVGAPKAIAAPSKYPKSDALRDWDLLPAKPNWARTFEPVWQPGEAGAGVALQAFVKTSMKTYAADRNRPDIGGTSRLSPHLHFGEITPEACWRAAAAAAARQKDSDTGFETFCKEIAWREFSYGLLFHFPDLPEQPFRKEFSVFPWRTSAEHLKAWQRGQTGYPVVDAGMRELWSTGYMHNRVRMIVASFLIKHLMLPWQSGEAWFWDTLVDADLANNAASWQWVAGSGADAAPYFRIFNPMLQGVKFDPNGEYVRAHVPELAKLAAADIHAPWEADADALKRAGVVLGKTYPKPIVDHAAARARALAAYETVKNNRAS